MIKDSMTVLQVDPSLFTAPYDAGLHGGLVHAGVAVTWATRPRRVNEREEIPNAHVLELFYRRADAMEHSKYRHIRKGLSHISGLIRLIHHVAVSRPSAVHFQWSVIPPLDSVAIWLIKKFSPVVITIHDTIPYNGEKISIFQNFGFLWPAFRASHIIVHTEAGKINLERRGLTSDKITVLPHGPLSLGVHVSPVAEHRAAESSVTYNFVLFGELKPYKGLDVVVEAVALLSNEDQLKLKVIVAGRLRMDLGSIMKRIHDLKIEHVFDFRLHRHTEEEMGSLFSICDCFLFPYRQIDASGVYFLAKPLGRWIIASNVGIFGEDMKTGVDGSLFPTGDCVSLARELQYALKAKPAGPDSSEQISWLEIGHKTRTLYHKLIG